MKFELELPIGDSTPGGDFTGLVVALLSWFMLGAGPLLLCLPTKLSKSMLIVPALLHVDPIAIGFFEGSAGTLLLVELLLLLLVLDGKRMLSAKIRENSISFSCLKSLRNCARKKSPLKCSNIKISRNVLFQIHS